MCDDFWREIEEPCAVPTSADCGVAVVHAGSRHGFSCARLPRYAHAPPLSAYVCTRAAPSELDPLCGSPATPAKAPRPAPGPGPGPRPGQIAGTVILAGAGLEGARRVYRKVATGALPGRIGYWGVHTFGDVVAVHKADEAAHVAVRSKIMEPESQYQRSGIEGGVITLEGFNEAKSFMNQPENIHLYESHIVRADQALVSQPSYKLREHVLE